MSTDEGAEEEAVEVKVLQDNTIEVGKSTADDGGEEESVPDFVFHGMAEEELDRNVAFVVEHDVGGDMKDIVVTRSGRRSIPNRKFTWDVKEEPEEVVDEGNWEDSLEESVISHDNEDGEHICDICGKSMSNSSNLRVHRRKCGASSRQWKFACDFCNEVNGMK